MFAGHQNTRYTRIFAPWVPALVRRLTEQAESVIYRDLGLT